MLVKSASTKECELLFRRRLERRGYRFDEYKKKWQLPRLAWTQVQFKGNSGIGVSSLVVSSLAGTGAGNLLIVSAGATNGTSGLISSVTGGGTWVVDTNSHTSSSGVFGLSNIAYCLAAPGGVTSFTVNFSASNNWSVCLQEYSITGPSFAFDISAATTRGAGTSQTGVGLTLTGVNDLIARVAVAPTTSVSVASPYTVMRTDVLSGAFASHAFGINISGPGAAPTATWTLGASVQFLEGAIAFSETQGSLPIFNDLTPGAGGCAIRKPTTVVW